MNLNRKVVILDYGTGNINSVKKACEYIGLNVEVRSDPNSILNSSCLIFPGQGAYGSVVAALKLKGLFESLISYLNSNRPLLGICIGFQLLFSKSEESALSNGLGFFKGGFKRFDDSVSPVPHMGWNTVSFPESLSKVLPDNLFYFVHSYYTDVVPENCKVGFTDYQTKFTSMIYKCPNVLATQFHPEKSGEAGLALLEYYFKNIQL